MQGDALDVDASEASQSVKVPSHAELRRGHQCTRDGCDSEATHKAWLHFRYGRRLVAGESLPTWLRVCDSAKCRKAAYGFILSETNKRGLSEQLAKHGRLGIDWPNAMIEFVPLGEKVWGPQQMAQVQTGRG